MGGSLGSLGRDGNRRGELRAGRSRGADGWVASPFSDLAAVREHRRLDCATPDAEPLADRDERQPGLVEPRGLRRLVGLQSPRQSRSPRPLAVVDDRLASDAVLARELLQGEPGIPVGEELGDSFGAQSGWSLIHFRAYFAARIGPGGRLEAVRSAARRTQYAPDQGLRPNTRVGTLSHQFHQCSTEVKPSLILVYTFPLEPFGCPQGAIGGNRRRFLVLVTLDSDT